MIELVLILNSIVLLNKLKFRLAFFFGLLGWIVMGINLIIYLIGLVISPSDYLFTFILLPWLISIIVIILLAVPKQRENKEKRELLKREILNLGTQFTRLEIKEISGKLGIDIELIKRIIINMVHNQEIYGDYFNSTKTVVFNQQVNIEQFEILMSKYKEWQEDGI